MRLKENCARCDISLEYIGESTEKRSTKIISVELDKMISRVITDVTVDKWKCKKCGLEVTITK